MEEIDWNADWTEPAVEVSGVTVERVAYLAVGLLAAWLRFCQLGLRPLSEAEAVQALAAFRFTRGDLLTPAGTVPALFTGNLLGFTLTGAGDVVARWLPALAGVLLVLLPYGLRHRLGRGGALAASILLAISPSLVYSSRTLDSAILVSAFSLALLVGLINYVDTNRPVYLYLGAVAAGLGLTAGPGFYSLLLSTVLFALLLYAVERLADRPTGWSALHEAWAALRAEKGLLAKTGAVLAGTFGLVATAFVLNPAGVGHAADLIGAWIQGFLPEPGGQPFVYPLLLLVCYEPLILLLGLVEAGRWALHRRTGAQEPGSLGASFPLTAFLVFWALLALLIVLLAGHRSASGILLVVVPLALLAGQGIERAWRWIGRRALWFQAGMVSLIALGVVAFLYLQVAAFGLSSPTSTVSVAGVTLYASSTYLLVALIALVLLVGLAAVAWIWRGPALLLAAGWITVVVGLGLFGFKAMWGVNFSHATDPRELMIGQTTLPDVHLFAERLQALSMQSSGDAHTLSFTLDAATGPVVAWYLRDFQNKTVVEGLSTPPQTVAAVTLAAQDLPIGETFRGQGFPLRAHWQPWGLWGQPLIRWLLFTEASQPTVDQEVVLWVASEP